MVNDPLGRLTLTREILPINRFRHKVLLSTLAHYQAFLSTKHGIGLVDETLRIIPWAETSNSTSRLHATLVYEMLAFSKPRLSEAVSFPKLSRSLYHSKSCRIQWFFMIELAFMCPHPLSAMVTCHLPECVVLVELTDLVSLWSSHCVIYISLWHSLLIDVSLLVMLRSIPIRRLAQTRFFFVKILLWSSLTIIWRQNLVEGSFISVDKFFSFTIDMRSTACYRPLSWFLRHKVLSLTALLWLYIINCSKLCLFPVNEIFSIVRILSNILIAKHCLFILEKLLSGAHWSAIAIFIHFSVWSILVDLWLIFLSRHVDLTVGGIISKHIFFLVSYCVAHTAFIIMSSHVLVHVDFIGLRLALVLKTKWLMACSWWQLL